MKHLHVKVAAITGAGSGIGRALAGELAARGCHLALSDVQPAGLADTAAAAAQRGVRVTTAIVDVADRAAVVGWAAQVAREHGRVNLLFNNAGVGLGTTLEAARPEDLAWIMGINFWGVVHGTQAFLPHLRASGEGHVVNLSSVLGLIAAPTQGAYCASKFAVRGFTEALRLELELEGAPVSATCVHPGGVATNIALASRIDASVTRLTGDTIEGRRRLAHEMIQVTRPEQAARQILRGVSRNARRVLVGPDAHIIDLLSRLLGVGVCALVLRRSRALQKARAHAAGNA